MHFRNKRQKRGRTPCHAGEEPCQFFRLRAVNTDSFGPSDVLAIIASMSAHQPDLFEAPVDTRVVEDVDAMAQAMSDGLEGEYVQLESRRFCGRWTTVRFDSVVAQFASQDIAVARRVRVPAGRWAFMVPLAVPGAARWNGHPVGADDVVVCPPRSDCLAFDPPLTQFAIITAGVTTALIKAARALLESDAAGPVVAACGCQALALRDRLTSVRDHAESGTRSAVSDTGYTLAERLTACLEQSMAAHDEAPAGSRSRIVCRAEEFFRSHVSEGVSVAQLSTVAGVSERSLRNAFYDVYTTSPKRYMKLWQLHQVRRALRAAQVATATVTEVATCHGFYELGRFAGAYKSLFGEAPSETLSKARHARALLGAA
jgi:AraC family ethanolamine operon transcriptional activator